MEATACRHPRTEPTSLDGMRWCPRCTQLVEARANKYGAEPAYVGAVRFASKREARRWETLQERVAAGEIQELARQVRYRLDVAGEHIADYVADFVYFDCVLRRLTVEDAKGHRTRDYMLKRRLMLAIYGIEVLET